ncbi:MAG TPA: MATE family efflux transporter [Ferrovibrio sp.]|uniref:MATE family efflux transporter n=1 Tax=Ferrovibrio sp. TaxID=1917215 RepID=UPI002B4B6BB1|nr:MATE family efflux transporter [Ferrovibrio sp.]HLT77001.1 MATE family efflux transporter [Ferrovibrio sp.]
MILTEARATLALALPIVGTQLAQIAIHTTDVLMLARLSDHALAVGALAFALFSFFWMLGIGLAIGVAPIASHAIGYDIADRASVRDAVQDGLLVSLGFTVVTALLLWFCEPFLVWFGQPAELIPDTMLLLRLLSASLLPMLGISVLRAFTASLSRPQPAMVLMIFAVGLNALLVYSLTFGAFGLPALGIAGAGLGSVLANWIVFLVFAVYVAREGQFGAYRLWHRPWQALRRSSLRRLIAYLRIAGPIALTFGSEVGLFSLAAQLMGRLGAAEVAAHQIALQWASISFMVPMGLAQAATVRVGLAVGARDHAGAARAGWIAIALSVGFMAMMALVFARAGAPLIALFVTDRASPVFALAVSYLAIAAMFQLVDGAQAVSNGALRGLKDMTVPMIFAAIGYWGAGLPAAIWLGFYTPLRGEGVWIGLVVGLAVSAVLLVWRFAFWARRLRRMQERQA